MLTAARDWRGTASMAAQQWTRASRASVSAQPATRENTVRQVRESDTESKIFSWSNSRMQNSVKRQQLLLSK